MTSFHNRVRQGESPQRLSRRSINSKGQVTIFIILGIIIVVGVVAFFIISNKTVKEVNTPTKLGPKAFIDSCVQDVVEESLEKILANGGVLEPTKTLRYNGTNYTYLCYTGDNYKPGYNLHPMLRLSIADSIREDTKDKVTKCFDTLREDFENKGYEVVGNETIYDIELYQGEVRINLKKSITIGTESTQHFENFNSKINHPWDTLLDAVDKIVSDEIKYCGYDLVAGTVIYPKIEVDKITYNRNKIYKVTDRDTGKSIQFATRSCTYPAGMMVS